MKPDDFSYTPAMTRNLRRYHHSNQSHFLTFSCYHRLPLFSNSSHRDLFLECLERVRRQYRFFVYGYVVMPEHVHLLVSETEVATLATAMQALKVSFVRRRADSTAGSNLHSGGRGGKATFWQKRYYDHNVRSYDSFAGKLDYIHYNPVKRGLCSTEMEWLWSSFRHYATAEVGVVEIESEWTTIRRTGRDPRLLGIHPETIVKPTSAE
jgi:putative transposase